MEELTGAIALILQDSPVEDAEEWAFMDYDLGGIHIGENEDLEEVINITQGLKEHDSAFVAFYNCFSSTNLEEFALSINFRTLVLATNYLLIS